MKQACHMKQPLSIVVVVEGEEVMPRVQISTSEDKLMACMTLGSMDRSSRSFWFLEGRICSKVLMALSYICCQGDPPLECICQGIPPLESHIAMSLAATAGKVIKCKGVFLHSSLRILILSLPTLSLFDSHWHSTSSKSPYFDKQFFIVRSCLGGMCLSEISIVDVNWCELQKNCINITSMINWELHPCQLSLWKLGSQLHKCVLFWDEIDWGISSEWCGVECSQSNTEASK
jgi:hypothetical protein